MEKRERPSWDEYFMFQAYLSATRSSCLNLPNGCVIVKDKRVRASGYNGAPPGIENCLERGCRKADKGVAFDEKGKSICRGLHAEDNGLAQLTREDTKGATMYTVVFPCSACAKDIAGSGINEVVYSKAYKGEDELAKEIFEEAGIKIRKLEIDLNKCYNFIKNLK
jgi:dCMP deaminase